MGLVDVRKPSSTEERAELIAEAVDRKCNFRTSMLPHMICNTELHTHLKRPQWIQRSNNANNAHNVHNANIHLLSLKDEQYSYPGCRFSLRSRPWTTLCTVNTIRVNMQSFCMPPSTDPHVDLSIHQFIKPLFIAGLLYWLVEEFHSPRQNDLVQ